MIRLLPFLILVICVFGLVDGRLIAPELLQLQSFIKFSQNSHDVDYLNRTSGCIQGHIFQQGDRGSPRRPCRKTATSVMKEFGVERKISSFNNTCAYFISGSKIVKTVDKPILSSSQSQHSIEITIFQSNCAAGWTSASGGSSLRVEIDPWNRNFAIHRCLLHHIGSDDYTYRCPIADVSTLMTVNKDCNALCGLNVSAVVDYEHYSAFDEVVGLTYGLNKVVISESLPDMIFTTLSVGKTKKQKKVHLKCCTSPPEPPAASIPTMTTSRAHGALNTSTTHLRAALDRFDAVYFVGASHMRYLWDSVVHAHYNASELLASLPQHHADETVANTWYINNYFSMELPALLRDICSAGSVFAPAHSGVDAQAKPGTVAFVLQTGSWDLDYNPPHNMLMFPNSSTAVVQAILEMAGNGYRCNGRRVEIVWLTSVPIPECEESGSSNSENIHHNRQRVTSDSAKKKEKSCFDKGYRNNYAIQAVNQYFVSQFQQALTESAETEQSGEIKSSSKSTKGSSHNIKSGTVREDTSHITSTSSHYLRIIDAFDIIYPHRNANVCGLHYLCCRHHRKDPVQMVTSPGGELLLGSVLNTLVQLSRRI